MNWKNVLLIFFLAFLLIFPNIFNLVRDDQPVIFILKQVGIALLFLLNPVVLFYKNIKAYLYFLTIFALLIPLVCFSIYLFDLSFGAKMAGLIFQTSLEETLEITQGYRLTFIIITLLFTGLYIFCVSKVSLKRIPFIGALIISLASIVLVWGKMFQLKRDYQVLHMFGILDEYYPMSVVSGVSQVLLASPKNLDEAEGFTFHAQKEDSLSKRQVYIFIIGESSRYDHWGINGYDRLTSPLLSKLKNLITYPHVASGAHFTWLSVPQMITRATPGNMDIQYKEKSILSAFDEVGFKTVWLSNQEPDYYTGSFTLHAETADFYLFPDAMQLDRNDPYDGRYLPVIDSIIGSGKENLFIVFHTMGSHWDYSKRYPDAFNAFKPSGKKVSITPPDSSKRKAIVNSYDNSILYTDYIIDSVIQTVKKYNLISSVTYISDHGEDLFEQDKRKLNFHLTASRSTLHVPFFIWTSEQYNEAYAQKREALLANHNKKIGENDVFYTLLGLANITFHDFDSTKNLSSDSFMDSKQEYIEQGHKQVDYFSDLPH